MSSVVRARVEQADDLPFARGQRPFDRAQLPAARGSARPGGVVIRRETAASPADDAGDRARQRVELEVLREVARGAGRERAQRFVGRPRRGRGRRSARGRVDADGRASASRRRARRRARGAGRARRPPPVARLGDDGTPACSRTVLIRRRASGSASAMTVLRAMARDHRHRRWQIVGPSLGLARSSASSSTRATCSGSSHVGTWPQPVSVTWRRAGSAAARAGPGASRCRRRSLVAPGDGRPGSSAPARSSGPVARSPRSVVAKPRRVRPRLRSAPAACSGGTRPGARRGASTRSVRRTRRRRTARSASGASQPGDAARLRQRRARVAALAVVDEAGGRAARSPSAPRPMRASCSATPPPSELPATCGAAQPSSSRKPADARASASTVGAGRRAPSESPKPGRSSAITSRSAAQPVEHRLPHLPLRADAVDQRERWRRCRWADVPARVMSLRKPGAHGVTLYRSAQSVDELEEADRAAWPHRYDRHRRRAAFRSSRSATCGCTSRGMGALRRPRRSRSSCAARAATSTTSTATATSTGSPRCSA